MQLSQGAATGTHWHFILKRNYANESSTDTEGRVQMSGIFRRKQLGKSPTVGKGKQECGSEIRKMNITGEMGDGRMKVEAENDGLLTGRGGKIREKNWQGKPKWQHKSGSRRNGRGVGKEREGEKEEMPKDEVVTLV